MDNEPIPQEAHVDKKVKGEPEKRQDKQRSSSRNRMTGRVDIPFFTKLTNKQFNLPGVAGAAIIGATLYSAAGGDVNTEVFASNVVPDTAHHEKMDGLPSQNTQIVDSREAKQAAEVKKNEIPKILNTESLFKSLNAHESQKLNTELPKLVKELDNYDIFNNLPSAIRDYDKIIDDASRQYSIPKRYIYGMLAIESSFNPEPPSNGIAEGIAQFRVDAAEEMGLAVDPENGIDERLIPEKAIPALARYVAKYRDFFGGDLSFGISNYHAGPGNIGEALRIYFLMRDRKDYGDDYAKFSELIKREKVNSYSLMDDTNTYMQVISTWDDDSIRYARKANAAAEVYDEYIRQRDKKGFNPDLSLVINDVASNTNKIYFQATR